MFSFSTVYNIFAFNGTFESVSPEEALKIASTEKDVVILDVRTPEEFTGTLGHLEGARLIPVQELGWRISEIEADKDKKILVICRRGHRSKTASRFLGENGFKRVVEINPGMEGLNRIPGAPIVHYPKSS